MEDVSHASVLNIRKLGCPLKKMSTYCAQFVGGHQLKTLAKFHRFIQMDLFFALEFHLYSAWHSQRRTSVQASLLAKETGVSVTACGRLGHSENTNFVPICDLLSSVILSKGNCVDILQQRQKVGPQFLHIYSPLDCFFISGLSPLTIFFPFLSFVCVSFSVYFEFKTRVIRFDLLPHLNSSHKRSQSQPMKKSPYFLRGSPEGLI